MRDDHLPPHERVQRNLSEEKACVDCLNNFLIKKRQFLIRANSFEDKTNKTDAFLVDLGNEQDKSRPCAIKVRTSGGDKDDILVAVRDPWYGEGDSRSKIGRDVLVDYHWYITRNNAKTILRVAKGRVIHEMVDKLFEEWIDRGYEIKPEMKKMHSEKIVGCVMQMHRDRHDGHHKMLAFIPPNILKKEDIFFLPC